MPKFKPGIIFPTMEEDAVITKAAMEDPDARPYTDAEWAIVKPVRGRGRPAGDGSKETGRGKKVEKECNEAGQNRPEGSAI